MKVSVNKTVEVSDVQRAQIAKELGQAHATRDDLKAWIWSMGEDWASALGDQTPVEDESEEQEVDEDLLGTDEAEDLI